MYQLYVDYGRLNAMKVTDSYPILRLDKCLESIGDASIFSGLDCK